MGDSTVSMQEDKSFSALLQRLLRRGRPIAFVGMMGSGKTLLARQLSVMLGLGVIDTDYEVEKRLGMTIAEYFATEGEEAFRKVEAQVVEEFLRQGAAIMSLGGGAFIRDDVRTKLLAEADCVYLNVPPEQLWARVRTRLVKRPMLNTDNPRATFDALYRERMPIYRLAHIHFDWQEETVVDTVMRLKSLLWQHLASEAS